jgi:hypothetical protein
MRKGPSGWLLSQKGILGGPRVLAPTPKRETDQRPSCVHYAPACSQRCGGRWVANFGPLWDKRDRPVRQGAAAPECTARWYANRVRKDKPRTACVAADAFVPIARDGQLREESRAARRSWSG